MNSLATKKRSRKKLILLKLSPLFGVLGFLFNMLWDFSTWNNGAILPVVNAVWEIDSSDDKMVQISDSPIRYLTLKKHVIGMAETIETMEHHGWNYLGNDIYEKDKETMIIDVETVGRHWAILHFYNVDSY
jgi:hypothetical protein